MGFFTSVGTQCYVNDPKIDQSDWKAYQYIRLRGDTMQVAESRL